MGPLAETRRGRWAAKDGTKVLLRLIEPGDNELERDFVNGLSRSTGYLRLMSWRLPSDDEICRWTHIDRQREGTVLATVYAGGIEKQVCVARVGSRIAMKLAEAGFLGFSRTVWKL